MLGAESLEKGKGFKNGLTDFMSQVSSSSISAGVVAGIFSFSAGLVYIGSANEAGIDPEVIKSWVTSVYVISGIFGILYPMYFRKPINFSNSIPGAAVFTAMSLNFTIEELMAGGLISGLILVILGLSGKVKKIMEYIPVPIVMGMISGAFLKFGINMAAPLATVPAAVILMIAAYFICSKMLPKIPGVLAAILVGVVYLIVTGVEFPVMDIQFRLPTFIVPDIFSSSILSVILTYSIPLTVLVIGAENAQAYGVLVSEKYDPPLNSMTFWSGIGGMLSSFFVLHNSNIAGPMTAICASPDTGKWESRWTGSVVQAIVVIAGGFFYASIVTFFQELPSYFLNIIVGLAILKVFISSFEGAFRDHKYIFSTIITFLVGASGIKILGITAPFWALVFGTSVYLFFERKPNETSAEAK